MAKRSLRKPRSRPAYDNRVEGRGESMVPSFDQTLNESLCRMQLVLPRWKEGPMVMRPWPALDYDNPELAVPGRASIEDLGQSHWICRVPAAAKWIGLPDKGCDRVTYLAYKPKRMIETAEDEQLKAHNPYIVARKAILAAAKAGEFGAKMPWDSQWNKIVGIGNEQGFLPPLKPLWYMQGMILSNGGRDYTDERECALGDDNNDDLVVVELSSSAGNGLMELLDTRRETPLDGADEEKTPWRYFTYGDATGQMTEAGELKGGLLITIFNPKVTKKFREHTSWDGKVADVQGWEAHVSKTWVNNNGQKFGASMDADQMSRAALRWQFWFDDPATQQEGLLRFPPIEEQCLMVAKAYAVVPQLLRYAWSDHEEFFTDDVNGVLRARRQGAVPGEEDEYEDEPVTAKKGRAARVIEDDDDEFDTDTAAAPAATKELDDEDDEFGDEAETAVETDDDGDGDSDNDEFDDANEVPKPKKGKSASVTTSTDADLAFEDEEEEEDDPDNAEEKTAPQPVDDVEAEMDASMKAAEAKAAKRTSTAPAAKKGGKGGGRRRRSKPSATK